MNNIQVTTERLTLELLTESHLNDLFILLSNPKVQKYFPKILNKLETKEFYEKIHHRYKIDGFCYWAVKRKSDAEFLGICGILKQQIDGKNEIEIGYRFLDKYWGNKYGTEAANGCIKYAKEKLLSKSVITLVRPINIPSIKVAENCGLKFEKETLFKQLPHYIYRKMVK
jgi:RimJ/RimL family protein N-acetyltransferase